MKDLFEQWESVSARLEGARVMLLLDFDGTLAPIAATPGEAAMPPENRALLERIVSSRGCTVAVVSGRELGDVERKVGIEGVVYVGNHGMETAGPGAPPRLAFSPLERGILERVREALARRLEGIRGIVIEDKGTGLAVHYRLAGDEDAPKVDAAVSEVVRACALESEVAVRRGKKVVELRPRSAPDKGTIVSLLVAEERKRQGDRTVVPVYVGDDVTDEDAFERLSGDGITVFVGERGESRAEYYVETSGGVTRLLGLLAARCGEGGAR